MFDRREFTVDDLRDRQGLFDYDSEHVAAANLAVPNNYGDAVLKGYVIPDIDERTFKLAREFLSKAHTAREGIHGSY